MSTAVRPTETICLHAPMLDNANRYITKLEADLKSARARGDNALRQLNLAVSAPKVIASFVVDGMVTTVLSTGAVRQLQTVAIDSATESGYRLEWVELPPVSTTPAAIVADAMANEPRGLVTLVEARG